MQGRVYRSGAGDDRILAGSGDDTFILGRADEAEAEDQVGSDAMGAMSLSVEQNASDSDASNQNNEAGDGGNDFISGGLGSDQYVYHAGAASVTVEEGWADTGSDSLVLAKGFSAQTLDVSLDGNTALFQAKGRSGSLTLNDVRMFENIAFENNDTFHAQLQARNSLIAGGAQNNYVYVATDNNTLNLGLGDDSIQIEAGNTATYVYRLGDGHDRIELVDGGVSLNLSGTFDVNDLRLKDTHDGLLLEITSGAVVGADAGENRDEIAGSILLSSESNTLSESKISGLSVNGAMLSQTQIADLFEGPRRPFAAQHEMISVPLSALHQAAEARVIDLPMTALIVPDIETSDVTGDSPAWELTLNNGAPLPSWMQFNAEKCSSW